MGLGEPVPGLRRGCLFAVHRCPRRPERGEHHENVFHSRFLLDPGHALAKVPEPHGSARPRMPDWTSFLKTDPSRASVAVPGTRADDRDGRHAPPRSDGGGPCTRQHIVSEPADDTQNRRKHAPFARTRRIARTTSGTPDNEPNTPPRQKCATCLATFAVMKDPRPVSTTETRRPGSFCKKARSSTFCSARRSSPISSPAAHFSANFDVGFYGSGWSSRGGRRIEAHQDVGEVRLGIDAVCLASRQDRVEVGETFTGRAVSNE